MSAFETPMLSSVTSRSAAATFVLDAASRKRSGTERFAYDVIVSECALSKTALRPNFASGLDSGLMRRFAITVNRDSSGSSAIAFAPLLASSSASPDAPSTNPRRISNVSFGAAFRARATMTGPCSARSTRSRRFMRVYDS